MIDFCWGVFWRMVGLAVAVAVLFVHGVMLGLTFGLGRTGYGRTDGTFLSRTGRCAYVALVQAGTMAA